MADAKARFRIEGEDATASAFRSAAANARASARQITTEYDQVAGKLKTAAQQVSGAYRAAFAVIGGGAAASLGRAVLDASTNLERIQSTLVAATGSQEAANREWQFAVGLADQLGLSVNATAEAYAKFSAAARGTSLEGAQAAEVFTAVSRAATALRLSSEDTSGVLLALSQMISKGKVQAEELRGQLGERLPGAFQLAATAMGKTTAELDDMLKSGEVMASDLLPKLAVELNKAYGPASAEAARGLGAEVNRVGNEWERFKQSLVDSEGMKSVARALADNMKAINDELKDPSGLGKPNPLDNMLTGIERLREPTLEYLGFLTKIVEKMKEWQFFGITAARDKLLGAITPESPAYQGPVRGTITRTGENIFAPPPVDPPPAIPEFKLAGTWIKEAIDDAKRRAKGAGVDIGAEITDAYKKASEEQVGVVLDEYQKTREGAIEYLREIRDTEAGRYRETSVYAEQAQRNMQDALANFFMNAEGGFRGLGRSLLQIFAELAAQKAAAGILEGLGVGKWFGSLFGFANGGEFKVGGAGGTDSQLVAFRATPGERVTVQTPGQQRGGGPSIVIHNNIDARGATQDLVQQLPRILEQNNRQIYANLARALPGVRFA